jgi:hypothetical protein
VAAGPLEDVDRAERVHLGVERGIGNRDADVRLRSEVEAHVRTVLGEGRSDRGVIPDVRLDELCALPHVLALPAGEVVQDDDVITPGDERVGYVRADEARPPCHDRPHPLISYGRCVRDVRRR